MTMKNKRALNVSAGHVSSITELQELSNDVFGTVGLFYMYIARPIFEKFGKKGEIAIRKGLRNYGYFRGEQMRKWHLQENIPINMESLQRYWDCGYAYMFLEEKISKGAQFSPYEVRQFEWKCPAYGMWEAENWTQFGYVYCDEIHQEITRGYHPKGVAEIHENLNKGDPRCTFVFIMPPEENVDKSVYDSINKKIEDDPIAFGMNALKKTVIMVGSIYYYLAKAIVNDLGNEGKKTLVASLRDLGKKRAELIKETLRKSGKEVSLKNALDHFDLPYNLAWKISNEDKVVVHSCPLADLWKELGDKDLGALYCKNTYEPIFDALSIKAEVTECMMCGSDKCTIKKSTK